MIAGCDQPAGAEEVDALPGAVEPRIGPALATDCAGEPLPSCANGNTGPSCDYRCDDGAASCGFEYYCHADLRVWGIGMTRAHLFEFPPSASAGAIVSAFETWVSEHESDLELPGGITTGLLQFEPADNFRVDHGLLSVLRVQQFYDASPSHPSVPIVGSGALLTLEADQSGVIALNGTIIDPRAGYAHRTAQAPISKGTESIRYHASQATGIAEAEITVSNVQLVAVPWAEQLGWFGVASAGVVGVGRVIVDADPAASGPVLALLAFDDGSAASLADPAPVEVVTEDPNSDPLVDPIQEATVNELFDGSPLLGSIDDVSSDPQLASEEVVVLDLLENAFAEVNLPSDFARFSEPQGEFLVTQPGAQFGAQRLFQLAKGGYALVERVAVGAWDSANPLDNLASDFPPGAFRPRVVIGYNHSALTGAAAETFVLQPTGQVGAVMPEANQRPGPGLEREVLAFLPLGTGNSDADIVLHELGHAFDAFLAPGWARNYVPGCGDACDATCDENTTDEAPALTETIAQMFALWELMRVFPNLAHDTCNVMEKVKTGGSNSALVHSPTCIGQGDAIGQFVRDDAPACADPTVCDKPSRNEGDPQMGQPNVCDISEGYNVFSVLQAWWNTLHGVYCERSFPFTCTSVATEVWPPGCDAPGSPSPCATADEVAGLAFVYALRTNPLSYNEFFDSMARFVSCNYGDDAYDQLNQALCDHQIRDCTEPAPTACQTCGNNLREANEQCDGSDLSVPELGFVPTCVDLGYDGGVLGCAANCTYDESMCTIAGTTTGATSTTTGSSGSGVQTDPQGSGDEGGGGDGCACTTGTDRGGSVFGGLVLLLGAGRRRRDRRKTRRVDDHTRASWGMCSGLGLVILATLGCGDDSTVATTAASTDTSVTTTTGGQATSDSEAVPEGWPEAWFGDFYRDPDQVLGVEHPGVGGLGSYQNFRIAAGSLNLEFFTCNGYTREEASYTTEINGASLRVLPPDGESGVVWESGLTWGEVLLHPGPTCDELTVELVALEDGFPPDDFVTQHHRGRICVIDPCGEGIPDDKLVIDICPGSEQHCMPTDED